MSPPPVVSIVLPTKNGMATLPSLLDAIARQRTDRPVELVAVDSASTDGTIDLLRGHVDHLISIAAGEFNHGTTRNLGVERTSGELVILLVQDALPASDSWLDALTSPFLADDRLAGTFARQIPRADASAITRHYLARAQASSGTARTVGVASPEEFDALDPVAQFERCTFDNVCSCIRRSVWNAHPFRPTPIAEDLEWAKEVLLAGYRLAYVPEAAVIHSHERSVRYEFNRTTTLHRRLYELFRLRTIPTLPLLARATASSLVVHLRRQKKGSGVFFYDRALRKKTPDPFFRSMALAVAWPLGQYLGALSAVRGWNAFRSAP